MGEKQKYFSALALFLLPHPLRWNLNPAVQWTVTCSLPLSAAQLKTALQKRIKTQQFPTEIGMMYSNIQQDTSPVFRQWGLRDSHLDISQWLQRNCQTPLDKPSIYPQASSVLRGPTFSPWKCGVFHFLQIQCNPSVPARQHKTHLNKIEFISTPTSPKAVREHNKTTTKERKWQRKTPQ